MFKKKIPISEPDYFKTTGAPKEDNRYYVEPKKKGENSKGNSQKINLGE